MSQSDQDSPQDYDEDALREAIKHFTTAQTKTSLRGNTRLQTYLETIQHQSAVFGLSEEHIIKLVDVAAAGRYPDSVTSKLIRSLIPAASVPIDAVVNAISWMCTNKPSVSTQALLLRWIILVYEYIDDKKTLHALYGLIFLFVHSTVLAPHVCHLLYLLTTREDVRLVRVQQLLLFQQKMGVKPYAMGLLSLYKDLCPHYLSIAIPGSRRVFFRQLDRKWADVIQGVQQRNGPRGHRIIDEEEKQPSKKRKIEVIPMVTPASAVTAARTDSEPATLSGVPFVSIKSFASLLEHYDNLELPSQLASALRSPLLQLYLSTKPEVSVPYRLTSWLEHTLCELLLKSSDISKETTAELLSLLVQFCDFLQEGVPAVNRVLLQYLVMWNGQDYKGSLARLITRIELMDFDALHDLLLVPLHHIFFSSNVYTKCLLTWSFTRLLENFASVEVQRYKTSVALQQPVTSDASTTNNSCLFDRGLEEFSPVGSILEYIKFMNNVFITALQLESDHPLLWHRILTFYSMVANLYPRHDVPLVILPPKTLLWRALFSRHTMVITRACSLLCQYRDSFKSLTDQSSKIPEGYEEFVSISKREVSKFNQIIYDYSDTLWRHKAFQSDRPGSIYCLVKREQVQGHVRGAANQMFSVYCHLAMLPVIKNFIKETQPPGLHVHPLSVRHHVDVYLEYLEQNNIGGIRDFIKTFIKRRS